MSATVKWWKRKVFLLLFLLLQFYLAKRLEEPYPCIILPSFAQAYEIDELPAVISYTFLLVHDKRIDTIGRNELLPYVPPNYWTFTAEHLFTLSDREVRIWQPLLREQFTVRPSSVLRIERWENRYNSPDRILSHKRIAIREIPISDELPR